MKKWLKVSISICILIGLVISSLLLYTGNYLYDLALNPTSDKSILLNNEKIKTDQEVVFNNKENIFDQSSDVYITSYDNLNLHGYSIEQDSNIWVITVHGYTSEGKEMAWAAKYFYDQGYNILSPDLRSHGLSEGDYIGMGWDDRLDIIQWINLLVENDPECKIILFGLSMGAATIMNVSGENMASNVKLLIEDCGYTSAWEVFSYHLEANTGLPERPILDSANLITRIRAGYTFDKGPIDQIEKCQVPILFIHGSNDTFVPSYMVDELYDKATCIKDKLIIEGAGHAQSYAANSNLYWGKIGEFIEKYL